MAQQGQPPHPPFTPGEKSMELAERMARILNDEAV
jgi:hypothetical protein